MADHDHYNSETHGITNPVYDSVYDGPQENVPPPPFDLDERTATHSMAVNAEDGEAMPPNEAAAPQDGDVVANQGDDPEIQKKKGEDGDEDDDDDDDDDDGEDCCDLNKRCLIAMFVAVGLFVILVIVLFVVLSMTLRKAEGSGGMMP